MRVVIVNTLYPPLVVGGAEKSVSLLAEALARRGDEVAVISLHPGRKTEIEMRNGVRVYRVPLRNVYWPFGRDVRPNIAARILWHLLDTWNPRAASEVGRILDIEEPDVVHTNNICGFSVAIFRQVRRRNIRLVHTLRDYYMLCARGTLFRGGNICARRCMDCRLLAHNRKWSSGRVDAVVSNSEYVMAAHRLQGWFHDVPGTIIYNIADQTQERHEQNPRPAARHSDARRGNDTLIFGSIGKIGPEKGIDALLRATELLAHPHWRLRIAGKGLESYIAGLKRRYPDPRIEWLGFTESREFYQSIDVNVVSSVWAEPLPRSLIECFAERKSAICARSGGIVEIAALGSVVETYAPKDAGALAAIMDGALGDTARWRGGGWRDEAAGQMFSEATIAGQYHEVYRQPGDTLVAAGNVRVKEMV